MNMRTEFELTLGLIYRHRHSCRAKKRFPQREVMDREKAKEKIIFERSKTTV